MHNDSPHGLPSDFPLVLVFAANPMGNSLIKTVAGGDVLIRSPHLRHDATATMEVRTNSLSVKFLLGPETILPEYAE